MRFENMGHDKQLRFLQNLHKRINLELFNGGLRTIAIDIRDLPPDCFAMYCKANSIEPDRILFSLDFKEYIDRQRTQKEQEIAVFQILLHEMVHQYCAETGIDDTGHNEQWQQAATAHGLHSVYKAGTLQEEWLDHTAEFLATAFVRIR